MPVKNRLKEIRMREYMLSQKDFANILNIESKAYSSWEKNNSRPTLEKALEIADILHKSIQGIGRAHV